MPLAHDDQLQQLNGSSESRCSFVGAALRGALHTGGRQGCCCCCEPLCEPRLRQEDFVFCGNLHRQNAVVVLHPLELRELATPQTWQPSRSYKRRTGTGLFYNVGVKRWAIFPAPPASDWAAPGWSTPPPSRRGRLGCAAAPARGPGTPGTARLRGWRRQGKQATKSGARREAGQIAARRPGSREVACRGSIGRQKTQPQALQSHPPGRVPLKL